MTLGEIIRDAYAEYVPAGGMLFDRFLLCRLAEAGFVVQARPRAGLVVTEQMRDEVREMHGGRFTDET